MVFIAFFTYFLLFKRRNIDLIIYKDLVVLEGFNTPKFITFFQAILYFSYKRLIKQRDYFNYYRLACRTSSRE